MDRGPKAFRHTDHLRLVERFTRADFNTLKYEVTVDDPGAYTKPWSGGFNLRWNSGAELFEYVCQENNRVEEDERRRRWRNTPDKPDRSLIRPIWSMKSMLSLQLWMVFG